MENFFFTFLPGHLDFHYVALKYCPLDYKVISEGMPSFQTPFQ